MTLKALIAKLQHEANNERLRVAGIRSYDAKRRTEGRIQGLRRAVRALRRFHEERLNS